MQQFPSDQTSRSLSTRKNRPALPGVVVPTTSVYVPAERQNWPQMPVYRQLGGTLPAPLFLFLAGVSVAVRYFAQLYPCSLADDGFSLALSFVLDASGAFSGGSSGSRFLAGSQ